MRAQTATCCWAAMGVTAWMQGGDACQATTTNYGSASRRDEQNQRPKLALQQRGLQTPGSCCARGAVQQHPAGAGLQASLAAAARRAATSPGLQLALLLLPCGHQHSHQPKPYLVVRRLAEPCVPCQRLLLRPCWEALDAGPQVPVLVSQAVRSSSRHDNVLQQQPLHTAQHSTAHVDITQCVVSG